MDALCLGVGPPPLGYVSDGSIEYLSTGGPYSTICQFSREKPMWTQQLGPNIGVLPHNSPAWNRIPVCNQMSPK